MEKSCLQATWDVKKKQVDNGINIGETPNLNWWMPDFWTINSTTGEKNTARGGPLDDGDRGLGFHVALFLHRADGHGQAGFSVGGNSG